MIKLAMLSIVLVASSTLVGMTSAPVALIEQDQRVPTSPKQRVLRELCKSQEEIARYERELEDSEALEIIKNLVTMYDQVGKMLSEEQKSAIEQELPQLKSFIKQANKYIDDNGPTNLAAHSK